MLARALVVWIGLAVCAVLNGGFRESVLVPRLSETAARAVSTLMLSAIILVVSALTIEWISARPHLDAWRIGTLWLIMTLVFEFVGGHYLFRVAWHQIFAEYNIFGGRIWMLALVVTLIAPAAAAAMKGRLP